MERGSWTKDWPDLLPGGKAPVTEYFRASMMVVLPHPMFQDIQEKGDVVSYQESYIFKEMCETNVSLFFTYHWHLQ